MSKKITIIGMQRSGTNFLQKLLENIEGIKYECPF